jgi:hypothetical protein
MLKRILAASVLLAITAFTTATVNAPGVAGLHAKGLTVHEWGTFTTVAGPDGRAVDWFPLGGPTDLPCFVERFRNRASAPVTTPVTATFASGDPKPSILLGKVAGVTVRVGPQPFDYEATRANLQGKVRMETPVIYFYAPTEMSANVRVDFPRGLMTEWYPHATVTQGDIGTATLRDPSQVGTIEWNDVRITPARTPSFPSGDAASHYYAARATDAAPIVVNGQAEKFLFYRGVANFDVPLSAEAVEEGAVRLRNLWAEELSSAILFENRGGRIGYRVHGVVGNSDVTLDAPLLNGNLASLRMELERVLVNAGLFAREASAMVATWNDSWFEEGTRVFYVLPPRSFETVLPLKVVPAPVSVARVFVGRMEIVTPASQRAVEAAVAANDVAALAPYARFFGPISDRILANTSDARVRQRVGEMANTLLTTYVRNSTSCP